MEAAKHEFEMAAADSNRAATIIRSHDYVGDYDLWAAKAFRLNVFANRAEALRLVALQTDKGRAMEAFRAVQEYLEMEPDSEKSLTAHLAGAKMLLETGHGDSALIEYKGLLEKTPDLADAWLGVGLALSQSGDLKEFREAEYYLTRFLELAPDNHPMKADIENTVKYMKTGR